jgi:hypothetical protein
VEDSEHAVHELVEAVREALACGMRCTDRAGSSVDADAIDALCQCSSRAIACVEHVRAALLCSLDQPQPDAGELAPSKTLCITGRFIWRVSSDLDKLVCATAATSDSC